VVDLNGVVLEKPNSDAEATEMLESLSGETHQVHTGVAIFKYTSDSSGADSIAQIASLAPVRAFAESSTVKFADLNSADVAAYVASGEPLDKAGGYGIQASGGQFVTSIEGCFYNVMGLPMHKVSRALSEIIASI